MPSYAKNNLENLATAVGRVDDREAASAREASVSIIDIRPGHCDGDHDDAAQQLIAALSALPPDSIQAVVDQLAIVVAHYDETGDGSALTHFADSLLMTARLHRNKAYIDALALAEQDSAGGPKTVEDFMTTMQERYA